MAATPHQAVADKRAPAAPSGARRSQRHSDNGGDRGQHEPPRDTIAPVTIARELSGQMPPAQVAEFDALQTRGAEPGRIGQCAAN